MVVVTQAESTTALVRWAARLAIMRGETLTVLCCLLGEPILPLEPVSAKHPEGAEEMLWLAAEAISEIQDMEIPLLVMRHLAPARAIIDAIQEREIELLCVGMDFTLPKDTTINRLGRRLLRFAPCKMFVLDPGDEDGSRYQRILLPMGLHLGAFALRTASSLAEKLDCTVTPFEVGSYFGTDSREVAHRSLLSKLKEAGIEASKWIKPTVSLTGAKWKSVVNKSRDSDLMLTGTTAIREVRKFRVEEKKQIGPEGPKVAIGLVRPWSLESKPSWIEMTVNHIFSWLPTLEPTERIDLFDRLQVGARWNIDFMMMMCLSTAIASLGLIQNSTAVVIGAMVVAPLMTPLIGAGLALVQGNTMFFRDSIKAMGFGIGAALLISLFLGFVVPMEQLTPELLARGAPTIIDLGVAFLSGAAAAYAVARPSLLGALAGVAIAAALVPPLATVGISLAEGVWKISEGAAILFATNLVAIILGAAFIYRRLGIQGSRLGRGLPLWGRRTVLFLCLLAVILTAPLGYRLAHQLRQGQTRPYTLPVSQSVRKAIKERVHQEYGVTFISASRFGAESDRDVAILLSAAKPVSINLISDLKKLVNEKIEENVTVDVYAFQEAGVEQTKY
ncbi:MAG: DUF389 domain-containing protein [Deltaproteobacteria bacterium]|nr:DUF389 domain-containing protein [Deltaproteobacteria bacterium]MDH3849749.1 DUF389 domain-containing protein [Deltaproteobacteria bacterium]MDH3927026.1 DUF389 domain-containing protein [Deltaproteobacteria bacterium]MDH3962688.1 DUF389 domain-containing protein [Deltaproteobacteria bacterium]